MKDFEKGFGEWVVRKRRSIITACLLVLLVAATGLPQLTLNSDARVFFGKDNPQLLAFETLEKTYTKHSNVMFAIKPKDGRVFSRKTLALIEELTNKSWQIPYSSRVDSITNFQYSTADGDDLFVRDLVQNADSLTDNEIVSISKYALAEPLLVNRLVSADAAVTAVNINIIKPGKSDQEVPEVAAYARKLLEQMQRDHPDVEFYLAGTVMFFAAFTDAALDDMFTLMPIMYLLLLVIMAVLLRSVSATLATMAVILMSMITAMGIAGWMGLAITIPSANAPTIILTLAVADCIHFLSRVIHKMREGMSKTDAIAESLHVNFKPIVLTSVTTFVGFLSMNFSDAPPFHDLGNVVALGVIIAMVYSLLFLPALMAVMPLKVRPAEKGQSAHIERFGSYVVSNRKTMWFVIISLISISFVGVPRINLDDRFDRYFDQSYEIRKATDFIESQLTGFNLIEYSLDAKEAGGINRPDYLQKIEQFADWYRTQPGVVNVNSINHVIKRLNKNMHDDNNAYYRIPDSRELTAQYTLLYELSLPYGLDLNDQINIDKSASRFTVSFVNISSKELRQTEERARRWLEKNAPEMLAHGASESMMFAHISERNIKQMLGGTALAFVIISCIMIFALRSLKLGILSLIPNLVPAFMAFGLWGWFVGEVGLAIAVVGTMTLGVIVDDTVHFLSKYQYGRRGHNMDSEQAVHYAFSTVGNALFKTSVILIVGFATLAFSGFKVNADMGFLAAVAIAFALLVDFILLPLLVLLFDSDKKQVALKEAESV